MDRLRTGMVCMMLLAFSMAGCLEGTFLDDDDCCEQGQLPIQIFNETWNDSHQFNSVFSTGYGTNHEYNASVNVTLELHWNISYRFEDPLVGSAGYVNVSFEQNEVVLVSQEYTGEGWDESVHFTLTLDENSTEQSGFSIYIQSMGSDHGLNGGEQDYYSIATEIYYH